MFSLWPLVLLQLGIPGSLGEPGMTGFIFNIVPKPVEYNPREPSNEKMYHLKL